MSTQIPKPADAIEEKTAPGTQPENIDKTPDTDVDSIELPDEDARDEDPGKPV